VSTESLIELARACDNHQLAAFSYRAQNGRHSERRVEPYRLVATDRRWYLVAFDLDRNAWRTFRVDRASAVKVTGHTFSPRPLSDPARMVAEALTTAGYATRAIVRVRAGAEEVARLIAPHVGVVEAEGAFSKVELGVDDFDWLAGYMIGLGLDFEVMEPVELRQHIAALAERLRAAHGPSAN
jgi:predicted DNA-binding transcriptional regulator YafY